jgi:hypothetical protein
MLMASRTPHFYHRSLDDWTSNDTSEKKTEVLYDPGNPFVCREAASIPGVTGICVVGITGLLLITASVLEW